jgi:colanic acid/amylovoran biosynthesis protein
MDDIRKHLPLCSVIIPVYNAQSYLCECLESVINQTLKNIEIICIDDGSTDDSFFILNEYAKKDIRIRILRQENRGGGIARNAAIKIAAGEYIGFIDADDWIDTNFFETLYNQAKQNRADLARTFQLRHHVDRIEEAGINTLILDRISRGELLTITDHAYSAVTAIYRRDYLLNNNIFFDTTRSSHDKLFTMQAVCYSQKSIPVGGTYYHHRDNVPNQLTVFDGKRLKNAGTANKHIADFLNTYYSGNKDDYLQAYKYLFNEPIMYFNMSIPVNTITEHQKRDFFYTMLYVFRKCKYKSELMRDYDNPYYSYYFLLKKKNFKKYIAFCKGELVNGKTRIKTLLGKIRRKILRIILGHEYFTGLERLKIVEQKLDRLAERVDIKLDKALCLTERIDTKLDEKSLETIASKYRQKIQVVSTGVQSSENNIRNAPSDSYLNILIDGTGVINKGAELMMYAVLQEIERNFPAANVFFPEHRADRLSQGASYIKTQLNFQIENVERLNRIHLVLDAGGFQFGDVWNWDRAKVIWFMNYMRLLKKAGSKIIFLPQAFGSFTTPNALYQAWLLNEYADCLFAREEESYKNLVSAGVDAEKIFLAPDFTALVPGHLLHQYEDLKDGIAVIPNAKMIEKGGMEDETYVMLLLSVIETCTGSGHRVFLLNHEGQKDLDLCLRVNMELPEQVPVITGLTAREIKALISRCFFVFSSRFHGAVSALCSGVPCVASSWSHKYKLLFDDFGMENCIFNGDNYTALTEMISRFLDTGYNKVVRTKLCNAAIGIKQKNISMWQKIWKDFSL